MKKLNAGAEQAADTSNKGSNSAPTTGRWIAGPVPVSKSKDAPHSALRRIWTPVGEQAD